MVALVHRGSLSTPCGDRSPRGADRVESRADGSVTVLAQTQKGRSPIPEFAALPTQGVYEMPRSRAVLNDPERRVVSETLMDGQIISEQAVQEIMPILQKLVRQAKASRRAQEHLTRAEIRAERDAWDGETNRRLFERRSGIAA